MITIIIHDSFSLPGAAHLLAGRGNEDRICVLSHNGCTAAVICDGAGSFRSGAAAAQLTAQTLAALLSERFDALFSDVGDSARLMAIRAVEQSLGAYSRRTGTPLPELACTILAAAVHEDGRCICLHLGDGIILQKNQGDSAPSVVSSPMTGLAPHSTYLTMNCDLSRYLRFYRWQSPDLSNILLLSDGAAEHLVRLCGGAGWVYTAPGELELPAIRAQLVRNTPRDDHSTVLISRIST